MAEGWRNVIFGGSAVPGVNNGYGARNSRYSLGYHTGVDFAKGGGQGINAPIGGKVISAGWGGPYGNTVVVQMDDGFFMRFAHMNRISVSKGQTIKAGEFVGTVGNTGTNSSGNHLHLEVMKPGTGGKFGAGNFVNPVDYLNGKKVSAEIGKAKGGVETDPKSPSSGDTTTNTTIVVDGSGGGGIKVPKFTKKDFYSMLEKNFGNIDALLAMDEEARAELGGKSIKWAVDEMVKQKVVNTDIMYTYLMKTAWFQKYSQAISDRLTYERTRPELFKTEKEATRTGIETALNQKGVQVAPDVLDQLARNAYVFGWSIDTIIDEAQKNEGALTYAGGEIADSIAEVEQYANDFGVQLTDADMRKIRWDSLDNIGTEPTKELLRERAAQTYGIFADQIRKGQATRVLAGAYFAKAADLLEMAPEDIDWSDPLFSGGKAFTTTDDKGQRVQKGLWDFEKEIRKDSRWLGTKNAKEEAMGTAAGILKTMGLA